MHEHSGLFRWDDSNSFGGGASELRVILENNLRVYGFKGAPFRRFALAVLLKLSLLTDLGVRLRFIAIYATLMGQGLSGGFNVEP